MEVEIKLAERSNANSIVELLNIVTLRLHRKNIKQWTYPWDFKEIEKDIKSRNIYKITKNQLIIGTFSIKDIGTKTWLPDSNAKALYLYRIAILPEYQRKNIGQQIIDFAFQISRDSKKTVYLDCWAGNEKLREFYTKSGFEFCGDFPEEDYMVSVFKYENGL